MNRTSACDPTNHPRQSARLEPKRVLSAGGSWRLDASSREQGIELQCRQPPGRPRACCQEEGLSRRKLRTYSHAGRHKPLDAFRSRRQHLALPLNHPYGVDSSFNYRSTNAELSAQNCQSTSPGGGDLKILRYRNGARATSPGRCILLHDASFQTHRESGAKKIPSPIGDGLFLYAAEILFPGLLASHIRHYPHGFVVTTVASLTLVGEPAGKDRLLPMSF